MNMEEEIKSRVTIFDVADRLGIKLRGKGKLFHSPFREDKHPSFSIFDNGRRFKDHANPNERGDVFAFCMRAMNVLFPEAKDALARMFGVNPDRTRKNAPERRRNALGESLISPEGKARLKPSIPPLEWREADAHKLESRRGYSVESQRIAYERGVFGFCEYKNFPAWIVTDGRGETAQARRVDGGFFPDAGGGHKAETLLNSNCSFPAGLNAAGNFEVLALCEGGTDFLAAFHLARLYGCENEIAPLAMFGASQDISPRALEAMDGKYVIIFPDKDKAGADALRKWGEKIETWAKILLYFDFEGFHTLDGGEVKDLSDFIGIDYDEWEKRRNLTNPYFEILNKRES